MVMTRNQSCRRNLTARKTLGEGPVFAHLGRLSDVSSRRKPAVPNDGVVRDQDRIELFWRTLRDIPVARQWEIQPELERKGALARAVNELNRIRNGGPIICEACNFTDDRSPLALRLASQCSARLVTGGPIPKGTTPFNRSPSPWLEPHAYREFQIHAPSNRPSHELFGFLTTEANAIVAPIHPKPIRGNTPSRIPP
jgi:hypothetical protein